MEETRQSTIEARTALRLVAVAGIGFVLITRAISSFPLKPRQLDGFGLLFVAVLAVAAALWLLLPEEAGKIRCHPDLLVPLGLTVLASAILSWLALVPAFGALLLPSWELKLGTLAFSISVFLVLYGRSLISNAIEARETSLENWYQRKHRWDVPMGEVLQTFPLGTESQRWQVILRPQSGIA